MRPNPQSLRVLAGARAQTGAGWNAAAAPKAWAAQHLDAASRGLTMLEHFVLFSSMVAAYGQPGATGAG